ncbi:MAG: ABC transporter permease [Candidatus Latescibacterota bacterium]
MKALRHIIKKEFIQIRRTRAMLGITFGMPIIQLLVLGFAVTGDVVHVPTVITDLDNSRHSRELVSRLENTRYLDVRSRENRFGAAEEYLVENRAIIAVTIPDRFSEDIVRGERPAILVQADAQNTNIALTGAGYVRLIVQSWMYGISSGKSLPVTITMINLESRVWYNPELRSAWYMIPGIIALLLTIVTMLLTALAIVRERELGTLEQLLVTPMTRIELILGKTVPFAILGMMELAMALGVAKLVYDIPIEGSLPLFFGLALLFIFCTLGVGILVSTVSHTQQQALFLSWFIMVFFILMSGLFLPLENMPGAVYYLTYLDPLRYFMVIVRELFLKGAGLADIWPQAAALATLAFVLLSAAVMSFNKRLG